MAAKENNPEANQYAKIICLETEIIQKQINMWSWYVIT